MILLDVNLLIYAYDSASPRRFAAGAWLEKTLSREPHVAFSWSAIQAFLRILTNARYPGALEPAAAVAIVRNILGRENVIILNPGPRHWELLADLIQDTKSYGPLITDAHIAALAIEHGATLCTHDRDFARFPKLKIEYPLS